MGVKEVCQKEKDINSRFDLEVTDSCRKNSFISCEAEIAKGGDKLPWALEGVKGENMESHWSVFPEVY